MPVLSPNRELTAAPFCAAYQPDLQVPAKPAEGADLALPPDGDADRGAHHSAPSLLEADLPAASGDSVGPWRFNTCAQGFDEYMNMVLDEAEEVHMRKNHRKPLGGRPKCCCAGRLGLSRLTEHAAAGRILLKGDNITLMQVAK